jgi:SAM-dependent methyltransferase
VEPLLYALVHAGLLELEADRFRNSTPARDCLAKGGAGYINRAWHRWPDNWRTMMQTAETIRTGVPQAKRSFADDDEDELYRFLAGLHDDTVRVGGYLADRPEIAAARSVVDIAGGGGGLAISLCQKHPELRADIAELDNVAPVTRRFIDEAGYGDRIGVVTGDLTDAPLQGQYEVALVKSFIQLFSPSISARVLKNIGEGVRPGGHIFVIGRIVDDSRVAPSYSVGFNLVFVNIYDEGRAHTQAEYRQWLAEAGFSKVESVPFSGVEAMLVGTKG